jgi:hypothetical protein
VGGRPAWAWAWHPRRRAAGPEPGRRGAGGLAGAGGWGRRSAGRRPAAGWWCRAPAWPQGAAAAAAQARTYLQVAPHVRRHVLQVARGVQRLALHAARHAQLAADVHAAEGVVAAVEAALDLVLAGGEEALHEAGLLHLRVERREVRGDRGAGGHVAPHGPVVVADRVARAAQQPDRGLLEPAQIGRAQPGGVRHQRQRLIAADDALAEFRLHVLGRALERVHVCCCCVRACVQREGRVGRGPVRGAPRGGRGTGAGELRGRSAARPRRLITRERPRCQRSSAKVVKAAAAWPARGPGRAGGAAHPPAALPRALAAAVWRLAYLACRERQRRASSSGGPPFSSR